MKFQALCKFSAGLRRQAEILPAEGLAIEINDPIGTWTFQLSLTGATMPTLGKMPFGDKSIEERQFAAKPARHSIV